MSDRLTRKEMKRQDSFQTAMGTGLEYVQRYRNQLILGVVALVVLALAATAWSVWSASREDQAQELLAEAIEVYGAPVDGGSADAEQADADAPTFSSQEARRERAAELFGEVHERFGSTDAGGVAGVYLGKIALTEGDTERARALWRDFVDEGDHALAAEVRLNLLRLDRAEGDAERVATELEGMLARQRKSLPGDVILHELAVTLEQLGREEEAAERYRQLLEEYQSSPFAEVARRKTAGDGPPRQLNFNLPS